MMMAMLLSMLLLLAFIDTAFAVTCFSCLGKNCKEGECQGDLCYSGLAPIGPFSSYPPPFSKGCLVSGGNVSSLLNHTLQVFKSEEGQFCSTDFCNEKWDERLTAIGRKEMVVCKKADSFGFTDVCVAPACWHGGTPSAYKGVNPKVSRGCSGFTIGIKRGMYCTSPPVGDMLLHVPVFGQTKDTKACYCTGKDLCNQGKLPRQFSPPLMHMSIDYTLQEVISLSSEGDIWIFNSDDLLPEPVNLTIIGPMYRLSLRTQWTTAGEEYQHTMLTTTVAPSTVAINNDTTRLNATAAEHVAETKEAAGAPGSGESGVMVATVGIRHFVLFLCLQFVHLLLFVVITN